MDSATDTSNSDEKLWMTIVAKGTKGVLGEEAVLTVDISDYATAEHLNNDLLEDLGDFEITSFSSNFKCEGFIENNRVLDSVFDVLVSDHLTVGEWLVLEAWAHKQGTHAEFETSKLIDGMRGAYVGTFEDTEELAKHHVKNHIDLSSYDDLIVNNIDYAAMGTDILWRGLYDFEPVKDPESNKAYYFNN